MQDDIAKNRNAPEYSYLKSEQGMTASLHNFKPIPPGLGITTKGYEEVNKLFITQNRLDIWRGFFQGTDRILVPSGPHGIGKSGIGLLIAATAFVQRKILFYYVRTFNSLTTSFLISLTLLSQIAVIF